MQIAFYNSNGLTKLKPLSNMSRYGCWSLIFVIDVITV